MITMPERTPYSIYYIQALLNSKYSEWFASLYGEVFRGGFIARGTKVLKKLPIRKIDFENIDEKTLHDDIALLQQELIQLQESIDNTHEVEFVVYGISCKGVCPKFREKVKEEQHE